MFLELLMNGFGESAGNVAGMMSPPLMASPQPRERKEEKCFTSALKTKS